MLPPTTGRPSGGREEGERFDNYHDPSANQPRWFGTPSRKRPAGPARGTPTPKKSAVAAKKGTTPRKAKPAGQAKPAVLVMGIDFGTTFTGLAYTFSLDAGKIQIITDWAEGNFDDPKTPSAIMFDRGHVTWGSETEGILGALRWFKLLLVNEGDLPADVQASPQLTEARRRLRDLGKSAIDVIASYLEQFWAHCLEKIKVAEGEETVDTSRFHVVITLPAIWPSYARLRMRQAVEKAGIMQPRRGVGKTSIEFVSEPEAAALAALSGVDGRHNIKVDDSFVIVDCGGGTVDLISYKVTRTNPMEVQEVVRGEGALCGAIFVDERFEDLLKQKLKLISEDALDRIEDTEIPEMMNRHWKNGIRRVFTGEPREWNIRYPYNLLGADLVGAHRYPTFTITSEEVEEVFKPIVEKIEALVTGQINAVDKKEDELPKYVILVGGFGRCKYLHEYLKKRLGVEVLQRQGFEPWSAISRGAVLHGLAQQKIASPLVAPIRSRIARASYGTVCQDKWDEEKHDQEDYIVDDITGEAKAIRQVRWNLIRDQTIDKGHLIPHEFYKYLERMPESLTTVLYMSKAEVPPTRQDDSVKEFCKIVWNINIDWNSLPIYKNTQGQEYRILHYAVEMKCEMGGSSFYVSHDGKRQASKHVSVEVYENSDI